MNREVAVLLRTLKAALAETIRRSDCGVQRDRLDEDPLHEEARQAGPALG